MHMTKDCPECGGSNHRISEECRYCGADLSDVPAGRH